MLIQLFKLRLGDSSSLNLVAGQRVRHFKRIHVCQQEKQWKPFWPPHLWFIWYISTNRGCALHLDYNLVLSETRNYSWNRQKKSKNKMSRFVKQIHTTERHVKEVYKTVNINGKQAVGDNLRLLLRSLLTTSEHQTHP